MTRLSLLVLVGLAAGCGRSTSSKPAPPASSAPAAAAEHDAPHYGEVMSEIGHRFELTGRAAKASRFRLARYEIGELEEALDDDLPHAAPPRRGDPAKLAALLKQLRTQRLPALEHSTEGRDAAGFAKSFSETAEICNACHAATGHDFVQIPEEPGQSIPRVDPLPSATPPAGSAP